MWTSFVFSSIRRSTKRKTRNPIMEESEMDDGVTIQSDGEDDFVPESKSTNPAFLSVLFSSGKRNITPISWCTCIMFSQHFYFLFLLVWPVPNIKLICGFVNSQRIWYLVSCHAPFLFFYTYYQPYLAYSCKYNVPYFKLGQLQLNFSIPVPLKTSSSSISANFKSGNQTCEINLH